MGPWLALWVLLYLPRALQGQSPHTRAAPSSVLQSFEDSKFQGEWYVLGLAGNTHTVADRSLLSPFTATFVLNKNNHLEAAYAMIRSEFQNRRNIQAGLAMVSDRLFLSPAFPWTRCCAVQGDRRSAGPAGMTGWGEWGGLMDSPGGALGVHSPPGDAETTRASFPGQLLQQVPRPSSPTHPEISFAWGSWIPA
ncbi:epididymal-specific lipocalin-12 isoform X3 [Bos indicus]|uniref:Epididymal-specific lipocalin-12 isoform X3 n=1 Tax=Bos indicus TaxID=9915 RepID=A0ABM4T6Y5_BOSIN